MLRECERRDGTAPVCCRIHRPQAARPGRYAKMGERIAVSTKTRGFGRIRARGRRRGPPGRGYERPKNALAFWWLHINFRFCSLARPQAELGVCRHGVLPMLAVEGLPEHGARVRVEAVDGHRVALLEVRVRRDGTGARRDWSGAGNS